MSRDEAIRTIVVGVDASSGAAGALCWAIAEAQLTGAEVVAVHAYEMERATPRASHALVPGLEAWAAAERQAFERVWCAPLTRSGVACRMVFRHGRAGSVLSDVARELDADLVVTGRRGLNTLAELVAGSASQYLVHRAGCPVVVVPTATPARGARPVAAAAARA